MTAFRPGSGFDGDEGDLELEGGRAIGAPEAGAEGSADLVLYVSPDSHASLRARTNLAAIVARYGPARVRFEVCDVSREPARAEADRILFTPTLVLKARSPAWIVGDLSDQAAVVQLLRLAGLEEPS